MMSTDYGGAYYGNSNMDYDGDDDDSPQTQQTQESSQSSPPLSESQSYAANASFWGYLQPNNDALARLDFFKVRPSYTIGRHPSNTIVLPGFKVSK
jgi:serine/threonine/tyrosine protein kinase RAD53